MTQVADRLTHVRVSCPAEREPDRIAKSQVSAGLMQIGGTVPRPDRPTDLNHPGAEPQVGDIDRGDVDAGQRGRQWCVWFR